MGVDLPSSPRDNGSVDTEITDFQVIFPQVVETVETVEDGPPVREEWVCVRGVGLVRP